MGTKVTINSITAGHGAAGDINSNDTTLADAFDNTLSRDGTSPNQMSADIDLNSNDLLNADTVNTTNLKLNGVSVVASNLSGATASQVANVPAGNIIATDVQAAIDELDTQMTTNDALDLKIANDLSDVSDPFLSLVNLNGAYVVANKAAANALTVVDGVKVFIISNPDGGEFTMRTGAAIGTYNDNSSISTGTKFTNGDGSDGLERDGGTTNKISVKWFGAFGDGSTDDQVAFTETRTHCDSTGAPMYIPPVLNYYRLTGTTQINAISGSIIGDGVRSLLFADNSTGLSCIKTSGAQHFRIANIGIMGAPLSGHGIEIVDGSHSSVVESVYIGWMGEDGIYQDNAVSMRYTHVEIDQNNGYRPTGHASNDVGRCKHGIRVMGGGSNNDCKFINCHINGAGTVYGLSVGESVGGQVESFKWINGLIQGAASYEEVYLQVRHGLILSTHVESSFPLINSAYSFTMENCNNMLVMNNFNSGDALLKGTTINSGFKDSLLSGITIESTAKDVILENVGYGGQTTGPTNGKIIDGGVNTVLKNLINNSNVTFGYGDNLPEARRLRFSSIMENWLVSPFLPEGIFRSGGVITREATIVHSGTYALKLVASSTSNYIGVRVDSEVVQKDRKIVVEAWIYNETTKSDANITLYFGSGNTGQLSSQHIGVWERVLGTFIIPAGSDTRNIRINSGFGNGTVYLDSLSIYEEFTTEAVKEISFTGIASEDLQGTRGALANVYTTGGTTTITNFLEPLINIPFTIKFDHVVTIANNSNISLNGGVNFVGAIGNMLTLIYNSDGVFYEISRKV